MLEDQIDHQCDVRIINLTNKFRYPSPYPRDEMIRFRVQELMADRQFAEGRVITITEVAAATGISRVTLSKLINRRGCVTGTDNLDKLCRYFRCDLTQLVEYIPDTAPPLRSRNAEKKLPVARK